MFLSFCTLCCVCRSYIMAVTRGWERSTIKRAGIYPEKETYTCEQKNIIPPPLESTLKWTSTALELFVMMTDLHQNRLLQLFLRVRAESESTEVASASADICGEAIYSKSAPNTSDEKLIYPISCKDSNKCKSPLTSSNLGYTKDNSVSPPTSKSTRK